MRQHTHDVRNGLNSLDLETSLLQELVSDAEGRGSVDRVRQQVRRLAEQLRALSTLFQDPQPYRAPISAHDLMLIWREQHETLPDRPSIEWAEKVTDEKVNVDAEMLAAVFRELLVNARTFRDGGPAIATCQREGDEIVIELREPKSLPVDTTGWGRHVFETTKRGGYGLGLISTRRLLNANGAYFTQRYVPEENALITRILLPVCK
jgi:light-regulated signal transduction histidine kinase (bacteriophytochrome)